MSCYVYARVPTASESNRGLLPFPGERKGQGPLDTCHVTWAYALYGYDHV